MNKTYSTPDAYKEYVEQTGDKELTRGDYAKIILAFNKKLVKAIIEKGYVFNPFARCLLSIIKQKRSYNRMAVKFGESNKKKQEILDRGGIPLETYKDKEGNIIGDNGGEEWLIYDIRPYYFQIFFSRGDMVFSKKLNLFKFKAMRSFTRAKDAYEKKMGDDHLKLIYYR